MTYCKILCSNITEEVEYSGVCLIRINVEYVGIYVNAAILLYWTNWNVEKDKEDCNSLLVLHVGFSET